MYKRAFPYIFAYLVLLCVMIVLLQAYPKAELHILLNSRHTPAMDAFFKHLTVLAEWPLYALVLLLLLRRKVWWVAFYAASEGVSALIVTVLKHAFHMPRPLVFFEEHIADFVPVVEGVNLHRGLSFPSGHTATFFIFVTVTVVLLALKTKDARRTMVCGRTIDVVPAVQVMLLLLAAFGGYSRIYLSQHFLMDVCVGSAIGFCVPFALYPLFKARLQRVSAED